MLTLSLELRLFMSILACYRLAQLLAVDDGPAFVFERVRLWLGRKAAHEDDELGRWHNLAEFARCPFCIGVWAALLLLLPVIYPSLAGDLLLLWWAIAGGQAFLEGRDGT